MKELFPALHASLRFLGRNKQLTAAGLLISIVLVGCMATENRWEASQMRAQVMSYYNDEIMENLIKANEHLPFVHLDITGLTNIDTSQISGSVGGGQTTNFTKPGPLGALHTISRSVMRPFSYSVSPQRGNSLQISAAPVLGQLAANSKTTSKETTKTVTTSPTPGKPTDPPPETVKTTTIEDQTVTPGPTNIYKLYDKYLHKFECEDAFHHTNSLIPPNEKYVPGTLKRWGTIYYYIKDTPSSRQIYYDFCVTLFTKGQAQSLGKELQAVETAIQGTRGLQALPESPTP